MCAANGGQAHGPLAPRYAWIAIIPPPALTARTLPCRRGGRARPGIDRATGLNSSDANVYRHIPSGSARRVLHAAPRACAVHSAIHVRCSPATCSTARCLLAISLFVESPSGSSSGRSAGVPARGATTRNPHKARHAAACRTRTPRRDPGRSWCPRTTGSHRGRRRRRPAGRSGSPDGARPHFDRDAAKQRIDCRPREVLLGTAHEAQHRAFDDQMAIRRGHVDFAWQVGLAVPCMYCMKQPAELSSDGRKLSCAPTCRTIAIVACKSLGSRETRVRSVSTPPDDVPIAMKSR